MKSYLNEFPETSLYKNKLISILLIGSVIIASIFIAIATDTYPLIGFIPIGIAGLLFASIVFIYRPHLFIKVFGLFLLLQLLIANNFGNESTLLGRGIKNVDEIIILLCFSLILLGRLSRGKAMIKTYIELPLFLLLIIGTLSSVLSAVPSYIAGSQLFLLLKGFMVFYIMANLRVNEETAGSYIRFFGIVAMVIFAFGLIDFITPSRLRTVLGNVSFIDWRAGIPSVQSIFIHPGTFGWFMAFAGLYAFAFYFVYNRPRFLALGLLFSLGSLLSFRRKPLGGIVGGLLVGIWRQPLRGKIRYGIIIASIGIVFFILFLPKIEILYQDLIRDYIAMEYPFQQARNALYAKSVVIAKDYFPLGAGLGRYGSWMSRVYYSPLYEKYGLSEVYGLSQTMPNFINDTFWPMILGETGFIGFILYIWIFSILFRMVYRQNRKATSKFAKAFSLGTLMIFVESLIESIASATYVAPPEAYFIFGSLGFAFALSHNRI